MDESPDFIQFEELGLNALDRAEQEPLALLADLQDQIAAFRPGHPTREAC
jgi:hypothetical protein